MGKPKLSKSYQAKGISGHFLVKSLLSVWNPDSGYLCRGIKCTWYEKAMEMPVVQNLGKHRKWRYTEDMTIHSGLDCSNKGKISIGVASSY